VINDPAGPGTPGTVIGQSPVGGATIVPGTAVQLRVATEPQPAALPPPPPPQQP
jgi:beta-lactam-binding protein with PASTA domain